MQTSFINLPAVEIACSGDLIQIRIPRQYSFELHNVLKKHAGFASVKIAKPYKPKSQKQLGWTHSACAFIAREAGEDVEVVRMRCKMRAISLGYPAHYTSYKVNGALVEITVPYSEADVSTTQDTFLIQAIQMDAAELGIILPEVFG